jgi:hypothetical protein
MRRVSLLIHLAVSSLLPLGCVSETHREMPASVKPAPRTVRTQEATRKPQATRSQNASQSVTDPCADRLHALSGPLLLYYSLHRKLPTKMDELRDIAGPDPDVAFDCPVSGKPYVFDAHGPKRSTGPGFLIIYDSQPTHGGRRWGVAAEEPKNTAQPLVTHVVMEPETTFRAAPQPTPNTTPPVPTKER